MLHPNGGWKDGKIPGNTARKHAHRYHWGGGGILSKQSHFIERSRGLYRVQVAKAGFAKLKGEQHTLT